VTWGVPAFREAIATKAREFNGIESDPDKHITVCCGATECMMATRLAAVNPCYVMTDIMPFGGTDDVAFSRQLVTEFGIAAVPGSSFYSPRSDGMTKLRFMFAKKDETLHAAGERLLKLRSLRRN
jgi:aspartate/methionine/tyrosine aminotransferase